MVEEIKPANELSTYNYDQAGNLLYSINPSGVKVLNRYNQNNQLIALEYYRPDGYGSYSANYEEIMAYEYDQVGNRVNASKAVKTVSGELEIESSITYSYDPLNRITDESRVIEDKQYTTSYLYDCYGNLTGIRYPGGSGYLEYNYDDLNQLRSIKNIAGDIANPAFDYYDNGSLEEISYANGISTTYTIDDNGRSDTININRTNLEDNNTENLLSIDYDYDGVGNIRSRSESSANNGEIKENTYEYDEVNRLTKANIHGSFYTEKGETPGYTLKDYNGDKGINLTAAEYEVVTLDYASGSIGVDFGRVLDGISRIELDTIGQIDHRIKENTIDILYSDNNDKYTMLDRRKWSFEKDFKGAIRIEIDTPVTARYIKVHCKYDDWDLELDENSTIVCVNIGEFKNVLSEMIRVYRVTNKATVIYSYDDVGNRTEMIVDGDITKYSYYPDTNRLMANGEYGYQYDEAGNLVKKGNKYSVSGDTLTFTETEGSSVEYYEYEYNLQNRLSRVKKNGELIAEFLYDVDGMRVKTDEKLEEKQENRTTYFVYGYAGKVMLEESSGETTYTSFIYAFAKTFAKVDGLINTTTLATADISYFHHDNQEKAFVFVGASNWPLSDIAEFSKKKGVYNMVFFDGGASTGLIIDNIRLVKGRRGKIRNILSVFKATIE